jgi:hypothetical protein
MKVAAEYVRIRSIQKNYLNVPLNVICMKCWRDLLHECIGNDCPMWMDDFEFTDMPGENPIGLGESKCALSLKEKLKVYQSMLDIMEAIDTDGIYEDELFRQIAERTLERSLQPPTRTMGTKKVAPAAKKQKKLPLG